MFRLKIKSATLIEAIVAILIISISFSVGLSILLNSIKPLKSNDFRNLNTSINKILIHTKEEQHYYDEQIKFKEYTIEKKVSNYEQYTDVLLVKFSIKNSKNKVIYERENWIYVSK